MTKLIKMSGKGGLVVPKEIRGKLNLKEGERFVAVALEEGVYFKKVDLPNLENLTKKIQAHFEKNKVSKKDIETAVKWARKEQF